MTFAAIWTAMRAGWAAVRANPALLWTGLITGAGVVLKLLLWRARRQGATEATERMERDALEQAYDGERTREEIERGIGAGAADRLRNSRWNRDR